jgi:hypothetical protein
MTAMASRGGKRISKYLLEINEAERRRAATVMRNPVFTDWVRTFRQKFIVNGFLKPVYSVDGRFSIADLRIKQFGNYILPWERQGEVFHDRPKAWIRAEDTWFWWYLTDGQEIIPSRVGLPEKYKIEGIPANLVWQEIASISKQLNLLGEGGGGILTAPHDLEDTYLAQDNPETRWEQDEEGYLEPHKLPSTPRWITIFHNYDRQSLKLSFEARPPWYFVVKHAFYDMPIDKLPVYCAVLNVNGHIDRISFLTSELSNEAREYVGNEMLKLPGDIKKGTETFSLREEQRDMVFWLWHFVGHSRDKKTLSYDQLETLTRLPKSSIQSSILRINKKLATKLDGILLGRVLRIAHTLGLGPNQTYRVLASKGLVMPREREIDGFDDINKLI